MSNITAKELNLLFPVTEVEIAGHTFKLKPFSFYETFIVAEKLQSVLGLFNTQMTVEDIARVVLSSRTGVEDILAMALELDVETIRCFDNKSAMKAIVKIIEVNRDFFSQSVQEELEGLNALMSGTPQTQTSTKKRSLTEKR